MHTYSLVRLVLEPDDPSLIPDVSLAASSGHRVTRYFHLLRGGGHTPGGSILFLAAHLPKLQQFFLGRMIALHDSRRDMDPAVPLPGLDSSTCSAQSFLHLVLFWKMLPLALIFVRIRLRTFLLHCVPVESCPVVQLPVLGWFYGRLSAGFLRFFAEQPTHF